MRGSDDGQRYRAAARRQFLAQATEAAIVERLRQDGIDYILAQWVDIHGTPRVKGVPAVAMSAFIGGSAGLRGRRDRGHGPGSAQPRHDRHARLRLVHGRAVGDGRGARRVRHPRRRRAVAVLLADRAQAGAGAAGRDRLPDAGRRRGRAHARSRASPTARSRRSTRTASTRWRSPATTSRACRPTCPICASWCGRWRAWAGSRTRPTTRTARPSSS